MKELPASARVSRCCRRWPQPALGLVLLCAAAASAVELPPPGRWSPIVEQSLGRVSELSTVGDLRAVAFGRDRFLLVWDRADGDPTLAARVVDAQGRLVGDEIVIASGLGRAGFVGVVAAPDGGVLFVWSVFESGTDSHHVQFRRLAPDGSTLGPIVEVSESASRTETYPDVAAAPDGRVLVVWGTRLSTGFPGSYRNELHERWLDAAGHPQGPEVLLLDSPLPQFPHLAAHPEGGFLLTWAAGFYRQRLDAAGQLVGQYETAPASAGAEYRLLGTPREVVGSYSSGNFTCFPDPVCIVPDLTIARPDRTPALQVFVADFGEAPEIAIHPNGAVYVAWQDFQASGRWVSADGSAAPPEELTTGNHLEVAAAHNGRGDILVAWARVVHDAAAGDPVVLSTKVFQIDSDGDGVSDVEDGCPAIADPAQLDADHDGLGAACDCDDSDPDNNALCLGAQGRFRVTVGWAASGDAGPGRPLPLTADTGSFWFFDAANLELVVKILDGCALNDRFWVFAAGLTNVATELTVEDRTTGARLVSRTAAGLPFPPLQDTNALPCP